MTAKPYPPTSLAFWRGYWVTLRPYLFFVSGVAGAVGLAAAPDLSWQRLVVAMVPFSLSYGLGQALTDVFQTDTDAISSPYRPLTQGLLSRRHVLILSLAGLTACGAILVVLNPWTIPLSILTVAGLATYTPFKRRWWGGPFWNSWIVALLPALGLLCGEPGLKPVFSRPVLWFAMGSVFFSYAVFVLLGYLKDISADRATGYQTLPVRAGWRTSVIVSAVFALLAVAASLGLLRLSGWTWKAGAFWAAGVLSYAYSHAATARTRDERKAHGPIAWVVRGFVLLHLGEATALRPDLAIPSLVFYLLFEVTLATRPERTQV